VTFIHLKFAARLVVQLCGIQERQLYSSLTRKVVSFERQVFSILIIANDVNCSMSQRAVVLILACWV